MTETLRQFAAACKTALTENEGKSGREIVCGLVTEALRDDRFVADNIASAEKERNVVYEDPDLGFCICVHRYAGAAEGAPHDHGPTWAIYGQADGETEMTDWEIIETPTDGKPGTVKKTKSYVMKPGDAHLYEPGDVHAPLRYSATRLLRIEGINTEKVTRTPLIAVD